MKATVPPEELELLELPPDELELPEPPPDELELLLDFPPELLPELLVAPELLVDPPVVPELLVDPPVVPELLVDPPVVPELLVDPVVPELLPDPELLPLSPPPLLLLPGPLSPPLELPAPTEPASPAPGDENDPHATATIDNATDIGKPEPIFFMATSPVAWVARYRSKGAGGRGTSDVLNRRSDIDDYPTRESPPRIRIRTPYLPEISVTIKAVCGGVEAALECVKGLRTLGGCFEQVGALPARFALSLKSAGTSPSRLRALADWIGGSV